MARAAVFKDITLIYTINLQTLDRDEKETVFIIGGYDSFNAFHSSSNRHLRAGAQSELH